MSGLGAVLLRYERVDLAKLTKELSQYAGGSRALFGAAKGLKGFRGGLVSDALAEVLVALVNKGRRTNLLPEWRTA